MTNVTKVDWCSYRSKMTPEGLVNRLSSVFDIADDFTVEGTGRGWNGYASAFDLKLLGKRVGSLATGGKHQRGWSQVTLTGEAMGHLTRPAETLSGLVEASTGQFKRVDIALTVSDGSVDSKRVLEAYRAGGFDCSANRPSCRTIVPEDPTEGTTVYIGKRDQPKFFRAYDKGYQMAKQYAQAGMVFEDFNGVPVADIFRLELEIKLDPDAFPSDILTNSDAFFAGAYPYLGTVVDANPATFCLTPQRQAELTLDASLACIRQQWGNTLFTALAAHHGDYLEVWRKIVGTEHCKALVERGAMFANV